MEIVKAEILWTRKCPSNCEYCSMATGEENTMSAKQWCKGIDQLHKLGCGFIAFYGAEPLADFDKLPEVVGYAESIGIHTTVITSGRVNKAKEKIKELYDNGAKSLSVSYDINTGELAAGKKMSYGAPLLKEWMKYPNIRDGAAITTLTALNFGAFPEHVKQMSNEGIWTFFDIIHPDLNHPGTKCKNFKGFESLLFCRWEHETHLKNMFIKLKHIKENNLLLHNSESFIDSIMGDDYLFNYNWNCAKYDEFPSWITIDYNGQVRPCDDFYMPGKYNMHLLRLVDHWEEWKKRWKEIVIKHCNGCCWNTHMDAHSIKRGDIPFSNYVHT